MEAKPKSELYSNNYTVDDFHWGISLGEGAFGNVKYCWLKKDKSKKVAIKAMKKIDII